MTTEEQSKLDAMAVKIDQMHDVIFVGNGSPPVMTRLARLETWGKILIGGTGFSAGTIITAMVAHFVR